MSDAPALTISLELNDEQLAAIAERVAALLGAGQANGTSSPWMTISEAAEYLRISERTLDRRIAGRRIRSTTIGRRRLLHRDDLDAAAGEEAAPTAPPRRRER